MNKEKAIRLLLVDDEKAFRQTLAKRLERRNMLVKQASDGEEALKILAEFPAHVVVMDVKMPGMGGLETLPLIRTDHPDCEVILLTGQAAVEDGISGIRSGAFDYLQKPVESENLTNKIRQACEKGRHQKALARESAMREVLEQKMVTAERLASLGTLAAGVGHEINNPLAIIAEAAGFMRLVLAKDGSESATHKERLDLALDKIEKSVNRARRITMQLLGFAGQPEAVLREISLDDLLDEVTLLVSGQALEQGVTVVREENTRPIVLWTDPHRLRQVIINLVSNGISSCGRGGRVKLGAGISDHAAMINVRDNGKGIPKENLSRIFEPFFTTKPPGKGTGLGLFVSQDMIEHLGGMIDVKSKVGKGTCFRVMIPLQAKALENKTESTSWRLKAIELKGRHNHGTCANQYISGG